MPQPIVHRYLIIGAGPAGLQLGYFLHQAGADYLILESSAIPGAFFTRYPRHGRLISLNKVHTGQKDPEIALRWDWNSLLSEGPGPLFSDYSQEYFPHADDMVAYLADFRRVHGLNVRFSTRVDHVERGGTGRGRFIVRAGDQDFEAECLIVATGWGGPHIPDIPGIELATGYEDVATDGEAFTDQRVLIIGKGNAAFETAQAMLDHAAVIHLAGPHPVTLAWNTKHPGHVRGQYGALLDSYWFKTLHGVLECEVDRIWREEGRFKAAISYTLAEEKAVLDYEAVIRCTGFVMDTGIFAGDCRPAMVAGGRLPAIRADFSSENVEDLYFAGTLMQARDFKGASSAFVDGFRYNVRTLAALLRERYEGVPLPCQMLAADSDALTAAVLDRVNGSSALWTQFEYLCDVLVVDPAAGTVLHYEDLPEDYAVGRFGADRLVFTVTLRWGRQEHRDVFAIRRHPVPERAHESAFLHPVVRAWRGREQIAERHLLEDLLACWRDPVRHVEPLRRFFAETLHR